MKFDAQRALVIYSGVLTAALAAVLLTGAAANVGPARFTTLDVERINVREPDGTLRLAISNRDSFPEIPVRGKEFTHPNRDTAGMLFVNDEGTEVGGLVWGGHERDGRRFSGGSLTFDGYEQDQTVQMMGFQDGKTRMSGLTVTDRPDESLDFAILSNIGNLSESEQAAAVTAANMTGQQRAFLGRQASGASELVLRDAAGKRRLVLSVASDGGARIDFLDDAGKVIRTMTPEG